MHKPAPRHDIPNPHPPGGVNGFFINMRNEPDDLSSPLLPFRRRFRRPGQIQINDEEPSPRRQFPGLAHNLALDPRRPSLSHNPPRKHQVANQRKDWICNAFRHSVKFYSKRLKTSRRKARLPIRSFGH